MIDVAREVMVRARSGRSVDAEGEVEAPRAMAAEDGVERLHDVRDGGGSINW
ncbi:hypothetical protein ACTMTF_47830 [Nonomuraea sp. ZG12]|uniref:hypothetical protein n=1 Tax=Nonomuraea sp. ZG12 TaxID=3452207 RepID=UPI003F8933FF